MFSWLFAFLKDFQNYEKRSAFHKLLLPFQFSSGSEIFKFCVIFSFNFNTIIKVVFSLIAPKAKFYEPNPLTTF